MIRKDKGENLILILCLLYLVIDIFHFFLVRISYNYHDDLVIYEAAYETTLLTCFRWGALILLSGVIILKVNQIIKLMVGFSYAAFVFILFYEVRLTSVTRGSIAYDLGLMEVIALIVVILFIRQSKIFKSNAKERYKAELLDM